MESHYQNNNKELLRLSNIYLDYGQYQALKNINFSLEYSKIHAIVGEHGAGKSSIGKIISGILKPKSGNIFFQNTNYPSFAIKSAQGLGIEMVHQTIPSLNEKFTVAENLFLTDIPRFSYKWKYKLIQKARKLLANYQIDIDPLTLVSQLNLSDRILIDILKHLRVKPKLLILDEALEKVTSSSLRMLIEIIRELKQIGMTVLLITHQIDDIYSLADKVSIIKKGEILVTDEVENIDRLNLIKIAYTQISMDSTPRELNKEFYQLLKYNEAILRNLPVNLIVIDTENHIKLINDYCKLFFDLEMESYLNVPLKQVLTTESKDLNLLINGVESIKEERNVYQIPITLKEKSIIGNMKIFPIYDGTFLIGNIIIIEDVSENTQLQKQVILSEKLASVGLLAAGVAHEINNPLGIIYNYLSYIKYAFPGKNLHEAIDNVNDEIHSIGNIVSNLHTFSDNSQITIEYLDIIELVRSMLTLIKHNAEYNHININFKYPETEMIVKASKNELKQVVLNLLKNSFEAMISGGNIVINIQKITVDMADFILIIFEDDGPGIKDENPNNIFLPFYSTKKGQEKSQGLGLSVSYGIIKKYRGTITVENLKNSGCRFTIKLPHSN
jgi:signal transduction histidine kinase/ABC-type multidrug transport system ATPase subunit